MVFNVKSPIPGFPQVREVELRKIDDFFMKLESKNDDTSFTLINPFLLREYDFELPSAYQELLNITENTSVLTLNIMIVTTPIENSTVNFLAPLVFNVDTKEMTQVLLDNLKYPNFGLTEKVSNFLNAEEATSS